MCAGSMCAGSPGSLASGDVASTSSLAGHGRGPGSRGSRQASSTDSQAESVVAAASASSSGPGSPSGRTPMSASARATTLRATSRWRRSVHSRPTDRLDVGGDPHPLQRLKQSRPQPRVDVDHWGERGCGNVVAPPARAVPSQIARWPVNGLSGWRRRWQLWHGGADVDLPSAARAAAGGGLGGVRPDELQAALEDQWRVVVQRGDVVAVLQHNLCHFLGTHGVHQQPGAHRLYHVVHPTAKHKQRLGDAAEIRASDRPQPGQGPGCLERQSVVPALSDPRFVDVVHHPGKRRDEWRQQRQEPGVLALGDELGVHHDYPGHLAAPLLGQPQAQRSADRQPHHEHVVAPAAQTVEVALQLGVPILPMGLVELLPAGAVPGQPRSGHGETSSGEVVTPRAHTPGTAGGAVAEHRPDRAAVGGPVGAVLCHGFTGSPWSMRPWGDYLAAAGLTVAGPRLPGHGTRWQELNQTHWEDWYAELERNFDRLRSRCDHVFVMGLSVGGTLCLRLAEQRGSEVAGVVVVNAQLITERKDARFLPLLAPFVASFPGVVDDINKPGVTERGYHRLPLKAARSLTRLWTVTRSDLGRVTQPLLVFRSRVDHVVEPVSTRLLMDAVGSQEVAEVVLENSYHVATLDNDAPLIFERSLEFVRAHAAEATAGGVRPDELQAALE